MKLFRLSRVEALTLGLLFLIALALAGVCVMFGAPLTGNMSGKIAALVGSIFAGLTVTLIRSLRATNGPAIIYLYFCMAGSLATLPVFMLNPFQ